MRTFQTASTAALLCLVMDSYCPNFEGGLQGSNPLSDGCLCSLMLAAFMEYLESLSQ
jgi:hypothetical protein